MAWTDNSSNETGFDVEVAPTSVGAWTSVGQTSANVTVLDVMGLGPSTTYYFRVRATNATGPSAWAAPSSATTDAAAPTAPAAPSSLTAAAVSSTSIHLTWTDVSDNEANFKLERATSGSGPWTQIATPVANAISYDDTGLSASTTYFYRIRATNAVGDSAWSNTTSDTTQAPPAVAPTAPTGLTAASQSSSMIRLGWTDTSNNESGFKIERGSSAAGPFTLVSTTSANVTTYDDTGLSASTTYYYRVSATNATGDSAYTTVANATTQAPPVSIPAAPSALTAVAQSASVIRLGWADNSSDETGFKIERALAAGGPWTLIATVGANTTTYDNTGLNSGTDYYYRVSATNSAGDSSPTAVAADYTDYLMVFYGTNDATIRESNNDASQQNMNWSSGDLSVGCYWQYVSATQYYDCDYAAIHFDFSLLAGASIVGAALGLDPSVLAADSRVTYAVSAFAAAWAYTGITFNNRPAAYSSGTATALQPISGSPVVWDVTAIVDAFATGTWANNGFMIYDTTTTFPFATLDFQSYFTSVDTALTQNVGPRVVVQFR